jgi:hypothetical protein
MPSPPPDQVSEPGTFRFRAEFRLPAMAIKLIGLLSELHGACRGGAASIC